MARGRVPVKRKKEEMMPCPGYLKDKLDKMVKNTAHLLDKDPKKIKSEYSVTTTTP